jgi:hypothetical protein
MAPEKQNAGRATRLFAALGSASAIIVAVCSLAITLYEARITRAHQQVSVWPRVVETVSDSGRLYIRNVENDGLGPALIRSYQVRVDGVVRHEWDDVVTTLLESPARHNGQFSLFRRGSVLLPGAHLQLLTIGPDTVSHRLIAAEHRVLTTVCYCSLYDQCWLARSDNPDPRPATRCVEGSADEFAK